MIPIKMLLHPVIFIISLIVYLTIRHFQSYWMPSTFISSYLLFIILFIIYNFLDSVLWLSDTLDLTECHPPLFPLVAYALDVVEEAIFWHESTKIYSYVAFYTFCSRQSLICGLFWVLCIITKVIFFYTFKSFDILDRLWLCIPDCI